MGCTTTPAVGLDAADGRLEVFARGTDEAVWHISRVDGAWTGWASLGGRFIGDPAVQRNADGRLEVFAQGTDGTYRQAAQRSPGVWPRRAAATCRVARLAM